MTSMISRLAPGPAQPEIAWVAREMRKLYQNNKPKPLKVGQWHLPYVETEDSNHPLFVGEDEPAIGSLVAHLESGGGAAAAVGKGEDRGEKRRAALARRRRRGARG